MAAFASCSSTEMLNGRRLLTVATSHVLCGQCDASQCILWSITTSRHEPAGMGSATTKPRAPAPARRDPAAAPSGGSEQIFVEAWDKGRVIEELARGRGRARQAGPQRSPASQRMPLLLLPQVDGYEDVRVPAPNLFQ